MDAGRRKKSLKRRHPGNHTKEDLQLTSISPAQAGVGSLAPSAETAQAVSSAGHLNALEHQDESRTGNKLPNGAPESSEGKAGQILLTPLV